MAKNSDKIKVLVCDDHSIFRAGLVGVLRTDPDIVVVGEARDGLDAVEKAIDLEPDVVILDVLMPRPLHDLEGRVATDRAPRDPGGSCVINRDRLPGRRGFVELGALHACS